LISAASRIAGSTSNADAVLGISDGSVSINRSISAELGQSVATSASIKSRLETVTETLP